MFHERLENLLKEMVLEAQALGAVVLEAENALPLAFYFRKHIPADGVDLLFGAVFEVVSGAVGDALSNALEFMGLSKSAPAEVNVDFGTVGLIAKRAAGYLVGMLFSKEDVSAGLALLVFREHLEKLEDILSKIEAKKD